MKRHIKRLIIYLVDKIAELQQYHFPSSFIWRWKLSYLTQTYEYETTLFFKRQVKRGMTVVDIGANIGYYTRIFSKLVGKDGLVHAFEPDAENYTFLKRNTQGLENVRLHNCAVTDEVGSVEFYHLDGATGTHSTLPIPDAQKRTVSGVSLDHFFQGKSFPHVIKIDVEGAEKAVFSGMSKGLRSKPIVIFEYQKSINEDLVNELSSHHKVYAMNRIGKATDIQKVRFRQGKVPYANLCLNDN